MNIYCESHFDPSVIVTTNTYPIVVSPGPVSAYVNPCGTIYAASIICTQININHINTDERAPEEVVKATTLAYPINLRSETPCAHVNPCGKIYRESVTCNQSNINFLNNDE